MKDYYVTITSLDDVTNGAIIKTQFKSRFESLDTSFDVSMKSNEWDSIQKNSKDAESTRIQRHKSRLDEEDVYMMSFSQESRGFR